MTAWEFGVVAAAPAQITQQSFRWLIIVGGLLCFAAMWLPLFDDFVPIRDEYGLACWLWLLIPAFGAAGRTASKVLYVVGRLVLITAGLCGCLALLVMAATLDSIALVFLPAPLVVFILGCWGGGNLARLTAIIAVGTLLSVAFLAETAAGGGLAILAIGASMQLLGAMAWSSRLGALQRERMAAAAASPPSCVTAQYTARIGGRVDSGS